MATSRGADSGADVDAMAMAHDERASLVTLLESLTSEQWDAPTLCERWRVREVVAHMFSYDELSTLGALGRLLRNGMSLDRANIAGLARYADHTPAQLLALARKHLHPSGLTAKFGGRIALADAMIHQQDIRRPLGLPRQIPADRITTVLEFASTARPLGAAPRIAGLQLTATDVEWSHGEGPEVRGPAEPLLMAMVGRRGITSELDGTGVAALEGRIAA
ncbi:maleylpyruvate isomerase family mycothiol-dependent enzyme [Pseudonocardia kujensis]|uniref:maleylpyruvate isomerase family mycothiol-dependent enzyme n=1 Tax=Pseudonocardia kujensis TaxID=1128675 RepID=UPI001E539307|nr:maleylpyruvate isomerase family mycothiol-dependent enzyme [Pseudonocardia kujensis]MCE0767419.1 maleylpyruvate isomerase family mycothiol-dependent enzyme [Pseudonocardia kujensis]